MKILFLDGWTSAPGGVKPTYLKDHGHEVVNPKLPDEDFAGAVRIAQAEFDQHRPQAVVGSSRGGAVARRRTAQPRHGSGRNGQRSPAGRPGPTGEDAGGRRPRLMMLQRRKD